MTRPLRARRARRVAAGALAWLVPLALDAQGVLIRGVTTTRYVELQRFVDDSVPVASTTSTDGTTSVTPDGLVVLCTTGSAWCRYKRSGPRVSAIPLTQDLNITGWGFGEGLSVHADLRARAVGGSAPDLWPRSGDRLDVMTAYAELDRGRVTARLGRQFTTNGLGVYNFDGADLVWRADRRLTLEGWGGWSLLRGVNGGYTSSNFAAVEELPPDRPALLLGMSARVRPSSFSALRVMYQREVRENRSGLYSERVAADATVRLGVGAVDGSYEKDLASGQTNEARLRWRSPLPAGFDLTLEARHYRPFFELWTIWGAFAPVGFDEMRTEGGWATADQRFSIDAHWAYRKWADANVGLAFQPLRSTGWRAGTDVAWRLQDRWVATGSYEADVGAGASRAQADLGLRYDVTRRFTVGVSGTAFQSIYEYRVGTGQVVGGGVDAGVWLTSVVRVVGDVAVYRQTAQDGAPFTNWSQTRGSLRLEWTMGSDPGMRRSTGGRP